MDLLAFPSLSLVLDEDTFLCAGLRRGLPLTSLVEPPPRRSLPTKALDRPLSMNVDVAFTRFLNGFKCVEDLPTQP